jgi:hypothetical protein
MANEKKNPLTDEVVSYEPNGPTGNAFWILGATSKALRRSGRGDLVGDYQRRATEGDYEHLLALCCALSYVASFCFSSYLLALGPPFTT